MKNLYIRYYEYEELSCMYDVLNKNTKYVNNCYFLQEYRFIRFMERMLGYGNFEFVRSFSELRYNCVSDFF